MRLCLRLLCTLFLAVCVVSSRADTFSFYLSASDGDSLRFLATTGADNSAFGATLSHVIFDGVPAAEDWTHLIFFANPGPYSGGFALTNRVDGFEIFGPQLYADIDGIPVIQTGTFEMTPYPGMTSDDSPYLEPLVIRDLTPQNPSVPEPSTLALLGTGMLGLAGALRRRPLRS